MSVFLFPNPLKNSYALGTRCAGEFIATTLAVGLGNGALANSILAYTKGHNLNFGWVSAAIGLSYSLVMISFSKISNFMNPAIGMGYATAGSLPWGEYLALAAAQLAGGMTAGLLTYLAYLPHYLAAPQIRSPSAGVEDLAGSADVDRVELRKQANGEVAAGGSADSPDTMDDDEGDTEAQQDQSGTSRRQRGLLQRLAQLVLRPEGSVPLKHGWDDGGSAVRSDTGQADPGPKRAYPRMAPAMRLPPAKRSSKILSTFATRPAIYCPPLNFLTEALATCVFVLLVLLLWKQGEFVDEAAGKLYLQVIFPLLFGTVVTLMTLTLGGPTSFAGNPARDLGPRAMHALLPIPGKGRSEWEYSWVPVAGPLLGGALAGVVYKAIRGML